MYFLNDVCIFKTHDHFTTLQVLGSEFAISQNPHMRKGGLIGASLIFAEIVKPVCLKSILFLGRMTIQVYLHLIQGRRKKPIPIYLIYSDNLISGLAAMAIGIGKETSNHTAELITPILTCLTGAPTNYNN